MASRGPCNICGLSTTKWCSRCENRHYCSQEHLDEDWPTHRKVCIATNFYIDPPPIPQPLSAPPPQSQQQQGATAPWDGNAHYQLRQSPPAPSNDPTLVFDALYFPTFGESPCMVSITCSPPENRGISLRPQPAIDSFLPAAAGRQPEYIIVTNTLGTERRYPLQIWFCPGASLTNRTIWRMTFGRAPRAVTGDVLVMKLTGRRLEGYLDASHLDIPALTQIFLLQA